MPNNGGAGWGWGTHGLWSGGQWLPSNLSGLQVWYAADKITGLSDDDLVALWSDLSGNGVDAVQAGDAAKPTYKTNIQNGLPAVRFDGTTDQLLASYSTYLSSFSVFAVIAPTGATYRAITEKVSDNNNRNMYFLVRETTDKLTIGFTSSASAYREVTSTGALTDDTTYVVGGVFDNANDLMYVSINATEESGANTFTPQDVGTSLGVGQQGGGLERFNGDIFELIIYNSALSATNRAKIRNYLNVKWVVY